ncbi:MAG TPA: protein kinase [Polyangia bacterium]|jgi:Tol biopolymer transport system component/tRNA A-37 threonylcarbamoyl transferase component Bud32|nr:protein kinase [Polyangia bacterium]
MLLGEGGMGAVFLAHDEVLSADIALKLVRQDVVHQKAVLERLRAEVLLAQKVAHANVCRTYDLEELDGSLFVKMEYILGETLAARHEQRGRMPIDEALSIARDIAAGLEAAHSQQVVHCDLKPENILIEHGTGRVVLMDFGLARAEARGLGVGARDISGTPAYMAPEQITGDTVDARADLYALGCVLYEMVTDEVPYPRVTSFEAAEEYLKAPVPDPRVRRPDLPLWLARVISRLLAKDPKQRFRSAGAVRSALEGPRRLTWRHIAMPALAITMLICAFGWYRANRRTDWRPDVQPRLPAYEEIANDPVISSDGQRLAYMSNREGEWRLYIEPLAGGPSQAIQLGYFLTPIHWAHDGRAILGVTRDSRLLRISLPSGNVSEVARNVIDVDDCAGRLVMAVAGTTQCPNCNRLVMQEETGPPPRERELTRLPVGLRVQQLRCDRQGRQLTYTAIIYSKQINGSQSDIYTMRLAEGVPRQLTQDGRYNRYPIFDPDGKSIVYVSLRSNSAELWEIPVDGGEPVPLTASSGRLPVNNTARVTPADISPDGKLLVYNEEFLSLPLSSYRFDTQDRRRISRTLSSVAQPNPTPDGREVLVRLARQDKNYAAAISINEGNERIITPADVLTITPDGHDLIYALNEAQGARVLAMPLVGGEARPLTSVPHNIDHLAVDPTGWVHFRLGPDEKHMGVLKVQLAGGKAVAEEAPENSLVVPAPSGGWVLVGIPVSLGHYRWHLIAPGQPLNGSPARTLEGRRYIAWAADGTSFLFSNGDEVRRHFVSTGEEQPLLHSELLEGGMALSADGKRLFLAEWSGHTARHMIVNFNERPRPIH